MAAETKDTEPMETPIPGCSSGDCAVAMTIQLKMASLHARVKMLETKLDSTALVTHDIEANTKELLVLFQTLKSGVRILSILGRIAQWLGWIAGAVAAYYAIKDAKIPPIF